MVLNLNQTEGFKMTQETFEKLAKLHQKIVFDYLHIMSEKQREELPTIRFTKYHLDFVEEACSYCVVNEVKYYLINGLPCKVIAI